MAYFLCWLRFANQDRISVEPKEPHVTLINKVTKLPVRRLELRAPDGRMFMAEIRRIIRRRSWVSLFDPFEVS